MFEVLVSTDFDEDAELQANLWNSLCRRVEGISEEQNFIVNAVSILQRHKESIMASKRPPP